MQYIVSIQFALANVPPALFYTHISKDSPQAIRGILPIRSYYRTFQPWIIQSRRHQ